MRTLGARLAIQARRLMGRPTVTIGWVERARPVLRRAANRPAATASRLRRVEADPPVAWARPAHHEPPPGGPTWPAETGPPGPPDAPAAPGAPLDAGVRERLRPYAGAAADRLRVHRGAPAEQVAHRHQAAAVTVGADVFFGRGQFRPHEPAGFALLVHEATHVSEAMRPNAAWRRATAAGAAAEEHAAAIHERAALVLPAAGPRPPEAADRAVRPSGPTSTAPVPAPVAPAPSAAPTPRPMAAPLRREPHRPAEPSPARTGGPAPAVPQDLRYQLRIEWERGG
ncbi:eCIS core domain-containing protein [Phytohabitans sp. LJ34]|uniref:eCIS core domain-containing protein n=1 Tax=Phytohabitans sp. LJ34 TaxID=3452217 RepID=UPI003F88CE5A